MALLASLAFASFVVSSDRVPGSEVADICLEEGGGTRPRYGRAYDLRKVDRRGSDESVGSFESYKDV